MPLADFFMGPCEAAGKAAMFACFILFLVACLKLIQWGWGKVFPKEPPA